jgi:hypothetical protein
MLARGVMNYIYKVILLSFLLFLSGCVPIYNSSFTYQPPKTSAGSLCLMQCTQSKSQCEVGDKISQETCLTRAHRDAEQEFAGYQAQQLKNNQPIKKSVSDFDKGQFCGSDNGHCAADYNFCYQSCGGIIEEHRTCVAFCDKERK